ncbi:hypothetical protein ACFQO1_03495 [Jejudonia soesokkakensis]|uniref:Uncharacterized protein n=1 Tax=Jejudonia soesokkakensis TaxID=1323432 RepID=A0ABW2MQX3_9FLAO
MESGMIIITVVLFTLIIVPILLIGFNTTSQSKTLLKGLRSLIEQDKGSMSKHIEHTTFILGLDEIKKTLYFFKKAEGVETSKKIDLTQVRICEVAKTTTRVKKEKGFEDIVDTISLRFTKIQSDEIELIDLYNEDDSLPVNGELDIAENWKTIVNQLILNKESIIQTPLSVKVALA